MQKESSKVDEDEFSMLPKSPSFYPFLGIVDTKKVSVCVQHIVIYSPSPTVRLSLF